MPWLCCCRQGDNDNLHNSAMRCSPSRHVQASRCVLCSGGQAGRHVLPTHEPRNLGKKIASPSQESFEARGQAERSEEGRKEQEARGDHMVLQRYRAKQVCDAREGRVLSTPHTHDSIPPALGASGHCDARTRKRRAGAGQGQLRDRISDRRPPR